MSRSLQVRREAMTVTPLGQAAITDISRNDDDGMEERVMFHMPTEVVTYGRTQHGLVTTPQLIEAGVSHYSRRRLITTGAVLEVHRNVYRFATAPDTLEQRCLAACLAVPDLAISGTSAGRLWQLRRMPSGPVHVMVKQRALELDEAIVHRTNRLDPSLDVVTRADGIRVLSVPRLVFDLARFLD
ncbi:MAG: type IV toxin-antitoxin system AbiEi family antitoxin domain-containing protein, partial [Ilumatobacteraceae bacterium]